MIPGTDLGHVSICLGRQTRVFLLCIYISVGKIIGFRTNFLAKRNKSFSVLVLFENIYIYI